MLPKTLSTIEKKALMDYKEKLYESLPNQIEFIKLYGSKVRGDAGEGSDVDLLVVAKEKDKDEQIRDKITEIEVRNIEKYGLPLSTTIMSQEQYKQHKKLPTLFIQFVEKEGVNL